MPAVVSAFFPEFVIGIKLVLVGSNQVCVVLEEVLVCMCWSPWSQSIPKVAMKAFFFLSQQLFIVSIESLLC